jgi:simple sugar transport system ATP-binding protein
MQIIAMQNICKSFPGTKAVDHVNFSLGEGEIISLLGENGAGKTTLMNILYGIHQPDEGEIFFRGERVQVKRPTDAIDLGICMVHQHFMLAPAFSILDNIIVGYEPKRGMFVDRRKALKEVQALIDRFGFQLNPCTKVSELSVGEQQRVEILKALYRNAKVLILDEPTAVLAPKEVDDLLKMLQSLRAGGTSIVIITHKLKETMTIADRIVVLRSGKLICDDVRPANTNESELARLMIGREINMDTRRPSKCAGDVALCVRNLSLTENGICKLRNISFSIRKGEILGVAGVEGNGQTQLLEALTGLTQVDAGEIALNGKRISGDAYSFIQNGFAHVPEDRTTMGLMLNLPLTDNAILGHHTQPFASRKGLLRKQEITAFTNHCIEKFQVKTPNCSVLARALSGGNQQKLIMARALMVESEVLVVAQPVRGIDVSATEYIHDQIFNYRDKGKSVLLVSADLDEVYQMSDRLVVLYNGEITLECKPSDYTKEEIGCYMLGVRKQCPSKNEEDGAAAVQK